MKTTVDIADPVLERAKETARRESTTLRALIEEGLRLTLEQRARRAENEPFRLRDARVGGEGLRPELADAAWERIWNLAYRGRGT